MSIIHRIPSAPNVELRDLRLVLTIARRGGLGPASRHLHVTQSALSHHLRALEERLGVTVFDRVGRGLAVNAHGSRLVELADRLLPQVLEVERALASPAPPPRTLRITTGCYTAYPWLPEALRRLTEAAPGTRVAIVVDATRRAADALLKGEVDLAVMPWLSDDTRLFARHLFDEEIAAVMHPDDPLAKRPTVPVTALADRRVLTHEMPAAELGWARATLGRSFSSLRHAERIPLTEAMVALTRAGEGVSLMGMWTIKEELANGTLVARPLRPRLRRPFAVVSVRERPADPRADVLASVLRAWGREAAPAAVNAGRAASRA
jgi:LysR family transcriptional regulator for metE and metH